jgi:hypothetical protein
MHTRPVAVITDNLWWSVHHRMPEITIYGAYQASDIVQFKTVEGYVFTGGWMYDFKESYWVNGSDRFPEDRITHWKYFSSYDRRTNNCVLSSVDPLSDHVGGGTHNIL